MKIYLLLFTFSCGNLSAATTVPLDKKDTPQPPVIKQDLQQGGAKFDWAPIEINGKSFILLEKLKLFYRADKLEYKDKHIHIEGGQWMAKFKISSHEVYLNKVKFLLSEPIRLKDKKNYISKLDLVTLIDPVLRPSYIVNARPFQTVIIDAGHGGKDKGSANLEADETLKLALELRDTFRKYRLKVILTRDADVTVPLADRVKIANAHDHAIMISLHYNSGPKQVHGFETYVMSARVANHNNKASIALATAVHSRCLLHLNNAKYGNDFKIEDRGIRRARFNILSNCRHPTIYIEAGFLTNKDEAAKIRSLAYRKTIAKAIAQGIQVYQRSIKK